MKRIAVIVPGGIGETPDGKPIAALTGLLERLGREFDITVYSLSYVAPNPGSKITLRAVNARHSDSLVLRMLSLSAKILKDHRAKQFDLIHGIWAFPPGFLAVLWGKLLRVPSLVSLQGGEAAHLPEIGYGNMVRPRLRKATLWACRRAYRITALTRYQWEQLRQFRLQRDDVQIIPYGAERYFIAGSEKTIKPPIHFIHVANLNEVKDQKTLLRAFALINRQMDSRLRIIGADYLNSQLQQIAAELGISDQVEFCGYVPHEQLPPHYQWAHLMLHTSLYEGQGVVLAEAAASGVVVCGTRVGLIEDWGEACTVPVEGGDAEGLAAKVLDLLKHPEQIAAKRTKALEWAQTHDAECTARQFADLYYRICKVCFFDRDR